MKKCTIVGYGADKQKLLKTLHKSCIFEVVKSDELDNATYKEDAKARDEINSKLAKLNFAFDFLKVQKRTGDRIVKDNSKKKNIKKGKVVDISYKKAKKQLIQQPVYIDYNDFMNLPNKADAVFSKIGELEDINLKLQELKTSEIKLNNQIEQLKVYEKVDIKFSDIVSTQNTVMVLGTVPKEKVEALGNVQKDYDNLYTEVIESDNKLQAVFVLLHRQIKDEAMLRLSTELFLKI